VKTIVTIDLALLIINPSAIPSGVAKAKMNSSQNNVLKSSLKALYKAILKDIASAYLCKPIAIIKSKDT